MAPLVVYRARGPAWLPWRFACRVHPWACGSGFATHGEALAAAWGHCHGYAPWKRTPPPIGRYA